MTPAFHASRLGEYRRHGDEADLVFTRDYDHPIERVWEFITQPALLRLWLAEAKVDLRLGGRYDLRWLNDPKGKLDWWPGTITALHPGRLLDSENSQHGPMRFELQRLGTDGTVIDGAPDAADGETLGATRLTFSNAIAPPQEKFITMSLAGWHIHLDHLAAALDDDPPVWESWYDYYFPVWKKLHTSYQHAYHLP
ncbi:SRPBCC domain-containing protein [Salinibacterium sp. ZJ454]|uniref:SRPBCC domain-containing protein n=1 Tax=Salinibacterium sp. ZJ454 TaxID=2708339 RepID=UPI0014209F88|nr:SRPBCC domain-containing protein [Salinibacterium sp. ZJ454]